MESDNDEIKERLIEDFRPRLKQHISVEPVLDYILFIENDQKELIRQKAKTEGDPAAANLLITAVLKKPHSPGWFKEFVDALSNAGCQLAADYMQDNLPEPEVEAENDTCVRLIRILIPSLLDMNTNQVCPHCSAKDLITQEDSEIITAETTNKGNRSGARELLKRIIMRGRPGWFSTFLDVLRVTQHRDLYQLMSGASQKDEKPLSVRDEPPENEAATQSPAVVETCDGPEGLDKDATEEIQDETDLYNAQSTEPRLPNSSEPSQPDGTESMAADGGPEKADIVLRDYQRDVARPALEGKNIIICLPTGSGKTRVAVYITKKHLDDRREGGQSGKVVVLVNKVPLVEQHFSSEFLPFLKDRYKVERVSGDSQLKISFTEIVKNNDVIICTAQILENYLERSVSGDDEGVHLSDLTLIVIDECHHTQKGGVYNHIMMRFLKQKHKNSRLKKEEKEPVPLPQILGLTASPGVGGATKMEKAEEHILRICANLDASGIMTWNLGEYKKQEAKKIIVNVEDRKMDPFGDVIKKIMNAIHEHAELNPTFELGSQNYEQWVVQTERDATKEENHKVRVCAEHLRRYNEGLQLSNTIRMCDAFNFLNKYQEEEMKSKTAPDSDVVIQITRTERFLFNLFKDNQQELLELAKQPQYENDSLSKLRAKILQEFSSREEARGIIFTKTRRSAIALSQWIQENPKFDDIGVKASYVIGGGDQSVVKPMTSAEQKDVLKKFSNGKVNLLIATTVAEEGLDISACNFVIRYGLVTNEISMIQARGRARAEDSSYTLVETKNSGVAEKECVNEYRINMMNKAIEKIRALNKADYDKKIMEYQIQAIMEEKIRMTKKKQKGIKNENATELKLNCRGCSKLACTGENIQIIENMHRVNVSSEFSELFILRENSTLQERRLDYETNGYITCKDCGQRWGSMMLFRGIECPCLHVKNFAVTLNGKKISKCSKWSELPVKFQAFDYAEHANRMAPSSDDDSDAE
ncbi:interferon-induced helicase C domain-containing protein 1 isoform X1 [Sphaeramia orbicularis]|uniref:RNA helicase n=1 Tax=Sphaeramia orbicularis TaxID=375764 RepID=A0A673CWX3_9TELE|nr:interferon-induced helicase C domain-containing protein 1 isoform X1 [Sphaeramia orbicularis]